MAIFVKNHLRVSVHFIFFLAVRWGERVQYKAVGFKVQIVSCPHHPLSPVIELGFRHPKKKERKP